MPILSLFKAGHPFDRSPHGFLMRYLQNLRYLTFGMISLWFFVVLYFKFLDSTIVMPRFIIFLIFGVIYLVIAEVMLNLTYSRVPDSAETLIMLYGIADITLITAGVMLSGGAISPFVLAYLFPMANFRIVYGNKGSFVVAGACLAAYFFALLISGDMLYIQLVNFLIVVAPCFMAFTYYLGLILASERDSRLEKKRLADEFMKSKLLYRLSKEVNQTRDYQPICDRIFEAIDPVVSVKGMKVLFDEDKSGQPIEIYAYETEEMDWSITVDFNSGEDIGPEVLRSIRCDCGFFVLPLGELDKSGVIVVRGSKDEMQPDYYDEYLKTVAEIAAAGLKNVATLNRLELQSVSDSLTGLLNNSYFFNRLQELIGEAKRYSIKFVVAMLDIDHFKLINDSHGHVFGDLVLRDCARIVRNAVRGADVVARYGGEEFGIIMPHTDIEGARSLMERVRQVVEEHEFTGEGVSSKVTVSIGVCAWKPDLDSTDLVRLADQALYRAKNSGRNMVVCELPGQDGEQGE